MRRWRLREKRVQRGKPTGGGGEGNADFFSIVLHYVSASESRFSVPMRVSELASDSCPLPLPLVSPLHK